MFEKATKVDKGRFARCRYLTATTRTLVPFSSLQKGRLLENVFIFSLIISKLSKSIQCVYRYKNLPRLSMIRMYLVSNQDTRSAENKTWFTVRLIPKRRPYHIQRLHP